jgi:hypothetical protein
MQTQIETDRHKHTQDTYRQTHTDTEKSHLVRLVVPANKNRAGSKVGRHKRLDPAGRLVESVPQELQVLLRTGFQNSACCGAVGARDLAKGQGVLHVLVGNLATVPRGYALQLESEHDALDLGATGTVLVIELT